MVAPAATPAVLLRLLLLRQRRRVLLLAVLILALLRWLPPLPVRMKALAMLQLLLVGRLFAAPVVTPVEPLRLLLLQPLPRRGLPLLAMVVLRGCPQLARGCHPYCGC